MKFRLPFFLSVLAILILWQAFSSLAANPIIFPSPAATFKRLAELCAELFFWRGVLFSVLRVFSAFFLVLLFGGAAGIFCGIFPFFRAFMAFPLAAIRSVPVVSFILLAIFAFKSDFVPVFSAFLMGFPMMTSAVSSGFAFGEDDKKLFFMADVFGLKNSQKIRFILLPKLKPFLESGIFSVFGMCWKVVAAAEVLSVPKNAAGAILQNAQVHLESAEVLAATIVLVALSFFFERILRLIFNAVCSSFSSLNANFSGRFLTPFGRAIRGSANATFLRSTPLRSGTRLRRAATIPNAMQAAQEVKIKNLTIKFGGKVLFKDFSITFGGGKTTAILAPSGGGKTTLLNWIAKDFLKKPRRRGQSAKPPVSFLFQEPRLLTTLTVFENVFLPLSNIFPKKDAAELAERFLDASGLSDKKERTTENLSGGEKQRVAMARAFAFPSQILLLDEAFQSLDEKIKLSLEETLKKLLKENPRTVIFAAHQKDEAENLADRIVEMDSCPLKIVSEMTISETAVSETAVSETQQGSANFQKLW